MSAAKTLGVELQDRDIAFLRGLFESRVMTADHISALHYDAKREYTKKRLQKLKDAGLIGERRRRVNEPAVHFLTRKAFSLLKSNGHLAGYPALGVNSFEVRANVSELTLRHELEIMDVKAAFHTALTVPAQFKLEEFHTWPLLYQFETTLPGAGRNFVVKPDGFVRIHEQEAGAKGFAHELFLEVDRSNENLDVLVHKAVCYLEFYRSGGFAIRNGGSRAKVEDFPFRVFMVMKSAERRNNTAERLAHNNPAILTMVWLTTLEEVTTDPLGPIWIRPADFRDATIGTPFYNERPSAVTVYRRKPEREAHIEAKMQKRRLNQD